MKKEKLKLAKRFYFMAQPPSHPTCGGKAHGMKCGAVQ